MFLYRNLIMLLLLWPLSTTAWGQLYNKEREQAAIDEVRQLLERYSDGLNTIGNPDEDPIERSTYYVSEFKKVFRKPDELVFNDIEPDRRSGNDLPVDRYAVNHIIWFPKSGITTQLYLKDVAYSPIQQTAGGSLFMNAYVMKTTKGQFLKDRAIKTATHRLEFKIGFVDKGKYFTDFRIIGVTEIPTVETTATPIASKGISGTATNAGSALPQTFHQTIAQLVTQLLTSGLPKGRPIRVEKFTYGTTGLCSQFSKVLNNFLVVRLRQQPGLNVLPPPEDLPPGAKNPPLDPATIRVEGTFVDGGGQVTLQVNWTDLQTKKNTLVPALRVPLTDVTTLNAPLRPDNFGQAVAMQQALQKGAIVNDFNIDLLTNRGKGRLTFNQGDSLKIYVRADRPCYMRFIYHTADGQHVLLDDNFYVDSLNVNRYVKIQKFFTVTEPYGTEILQLNASTSPFPALAIRQEDGFAFITDDIATINQKNRRADAPATTRRAEAQLTLTTTQKLK